MLRFISYPWSATDRTWRYIPHLVDHVKQFSGEFHLLEMARESNDGSGLIFSSVFGLTVPSESVLDSLENYLGNRIDLRWQGQIDEADYLSRITYVPRWKHPDELAGSLFEYFKYEARINRRAFHARYTNPISDLHPSKALHNQLKNLNITTVGELARYLRSNTMQDHFDEIELAMIENGFDDSYSFHFIPYIEDDADSLLLLKSAGLNPANIKKSGRRPTIAEAENVAHQLEDVTVDRVVLTKYTEVRLMRGNDWAIIYTYGHTPLPQFQLPHFSVAGNPKLLTALTEKLTVICGPLFLSSPGLFTRLFGA